MKEGMKEKEQRRKGEKYRTVADHEPRRVKEKNE